MLFTFGSIGTEFYSLGMPRGCHSSVTLPMFRPIVKPQFATIQTPVFVCCKYE